MQTVEKVIEIDAPVERVFDLFSDFENFPRWMSHIRDVHYTGRRYTRWTADAPLGTSVEWEAETTRFEPPHLIAWRSVRGDVDTKGEVSFRETRRGTTLMRVHLGYNPPAGRLGALVASLFGKDADQQLEEDLWRFAEVAERGRRRERSRERQPRGQRDAATRYDRRDYRDEEDERRGRRAAPHTGRGEGHREYRDEDERLRERERQRRAWPALSDARRMEDRERYEEERARDEGRPRREYRDRTRLRFDEEWDERQGEPLARDQRRDEEPGARRHALTPREREREQREREPDYDYTREAFRRGVDKLMVDPPSTRWRRWD